MKLFSLSDQSPIRRFRWLLLLAVLLASPFAFEAFYRWRYPLVLSSVQWCIRWDDPLQHHVYRPNCQSEIRLNGNVSRYSFNEDGLRDRPRAFFAKGSYQLYGDSVTKGLYLNPKFTFSRRLEEDLTPKLGYPFLNAALRMSGPTNLGMRLGLVAKNYPAKGLLLFLNGTDPADELFFRTRADGFDADGVPTHFRNPQVPGFRSAVITALQWFPRSALAIGMIRALRALEWGETFSRVPVNESTICGGLNRFARMAEGMKVPYVFIFLPLPNEAMERYSALFSAKYDPALYELLFRCAKKTNATVIDLRPLLPELRDEYIFGDYTHFTPKGINWILDHSEKEIFHALERRARR